jgi:hypothetical protein
VKNLFSSLWFFKCNLHRYAQAMQEAATAAEAAAAATEAAAAESARADAAEQASTTE